jgi:NADH:ubiquinone oxidoreductase subunit 5 (subunit L)/multisubunit Na+/H+ antiporter MnhA subunit
MSTVQFIHAYIGMPLIGFLISLFIKKSKEQTLSVISYSTAAIQLLLVLAYGISWFSHGSSATQFKELSVYSAENYEFFIDFLVDKLTLVFALLGASLTFLITIYSRYYLHREEGYKRFFNTILFFNLGYTLIIFSGNMETLFIGWEILGVSSFLLIAFYRDRLLPVKNALKVFSVYRIGDIGIILAMWLLHHLYHSNITFMEMNASVKLNAQLASASGIGLVTAFLFYISAAAKSAQLPFSSWLPRAMEGPTPSSAIFYGSMSVHIGAFLLLRTMHFWENQLVFKIFLIVAGLLTAVITSGISRVQSSIKSQIAYASIAQIGLIFVEIAFGLENLALIHILGNAFLRTYQLLISPSIVSHKIREQLYQGKEEIQVQNGAWQRFQRRIYLLNLKEWNLDHLLYRFIWNPLKKIGRGWKILNFKYVFWVMALVLAIGLFLRINESMLTPTLRHKLPFFFAFWGFLIAVKAFTERDSVRKSLTLIMFNHVSISLALSFNEHFDHAHHIWYLSGVVCAWALGYYIMTQLRKKEWVSLDNFYGHIYEYPKTGFVFLLVCLSLAGFPITPSFVGEDLIFSHIHLSQIGLAFFTAFSLVINGLATMRIYARVFLGPHIKTYHQIAKRSS